MFRVPGSIRVVNALYSYYCVVENADEITRTIRWPNLPAHIKAGIHDVASTFKRLLSGLPGGILGSLSLFDGLVAIHSRLKGEPEFPRTKQTKLRARLIALAIGTVDSQLRRDLICAVFGLLCLIGRAAEKAPREDEQGRPLPTADLMGYNALGIVFGPLLIGDLLNFSTIQIVSPDEGPVLLPATSPSVGRKRRRKTMEDSPPSTQSVDKIHVANSITEMLITHWREVVRQMKSLGVLMTVRDASGVSEHHPRWKSADWSPLKPGFGVSDTGESSVPRTPTPATGKPSKRRDRGGN